MTGCKHSHPYDEANTGYRSDGKRYCRACAREREAAKRIRTGKPNAPALMRAKTHCPQGHEYTPDNTYVNPSTGRRTCRACHQEWDRKHPKGKG